ncbi:Variant-specific surface protein [Giardia duodenalis]|uniref:Variant-specific surface protein n=1 Tax=Giardia intestinalis TaxID=5741 RepID=V6TN84_GIAIN|nr:Variant-specific surface protein [Giardia intestinalis]
MRSRFRWLLCSTEFRDMKQDPVRLLMQTRAVLCQLLASMLVGIGLIFAVALGQCTQGENGCAECDSTGKKCTKCNANGAAPYLKDDGTCVNKADCAGASKDHYAEETVDPVKGKTCKACATLAGCSTCEPGASSGALCTKCNANGAAPYLKDDGTCVNKADCAGASKDHYAEETVDPVKGKTCKACATLAGCSTCEPGASSGALCTKCNPNDPSNKKYLKGGACVTAEECARDNMHYADDTVNSSGTKECKACRGGKRPDTTGTKCVTCSDANCERCDQSDVCARCSTGTPPENGKCPAAGKGCHSSCDSCTSDAMTNQANKCTGCKEGRYLKPDPVGGQSGTCLTAEECTSDKTHFTKEKTGDSKGMCLPCNDATHGIIGCKKCALKTLSGETESTVVCSECTNKRLTPSGNACLDNCPAGTYPNDNNLCTPCHDTCAECNGDANAASCTACYPGYSLLYGSGTAGTCVKECTGAFGANCTDGQCTADVGGAKYCAQCKDGYAPIDGICTVVAAAGRASVCTAAGGKCTACTGAYVLISGGCYGVAKLPGKAICTAANNGKCTRCTANNQVPVQEKCPECSEGCAKCENSNACTDCLPGYYKNKSSACIPCSKDSTPITGVPNCVSCAPPAGNSGPVTCYIKTDGDNTGGSVNKSGLSTGAIAGISVAVIVVVGGLVGFLCWWFLCRGKA